MRITGADKAFSQALVALTLHAHSVSVQPPIHPGDLRSAGRIYQRGGDRACVAG